MSIEGHSRKHSGSVGSRQSYISRTTSTPPPQVEASAGAIPTFLPCASTASMFLYTRQGNIHCLQHDSLALERTFERHKADITLLSVDNVSERGQGRLVVSFDTEMTAIVWDIYTGDELARFASYEPLTTAAWMKNGCIAFGNSKGNIIVFEPATSEHTSSRTIFDPVTALAPAADCLTYAIGYQNGSVLIATLQPQFTIVHTLSTSRAPSPVVGLAWHASSSKQKSDMLAIQSEDGDLRVWSVIKATGTEAPKVIRVLKRGDYVEGGRNWIAWSKNGRIIQYAQGETWAWDVRTKHVAYEQVPTIENVLGIANHGPTAALFTVAPDFSVQQYDLNPPALVRNVNPEQVQRASAQSTPKINAKNIIGAAPPQSAYNPTDFNMSGLQSLATIQEVTSQAAANRSRQGRENPTSPLSTSSKAESASSRSSTGLSRRRDRAPSVSSRAPSGTVFSALSTPMIARDSVVSPFWASASVASSGRRTRESRLKNEVLRSPDVPKIDLFPFTRQRLAKLPYAPQTTSLDPTSATADELRRQMLSMVFGWDGDIVEMIRGERERHPPSSTNAALLGKWLGETEMNPMSMMASDNISQTDWMLLALSNMNGAGEAGKQMGRAFAEKLINSGDIHTAATIYLGIQEAEEAVDVYVSRNYYMEGILLTCLLFPKEWQRQSHLVQRWGEYVVENSQQHLAVRCFAATGAENSMAWSSPTQSPFASTKQQHLPNISDMISPPVSPPGMDHPSKIQLMTSKNPALRLITSFGQNKNDSYSFPGLKTDDGTPIAGPGITPIIDSALSPGGTPGGARLLPGRAKRSGSHVRLSSIGETPIESNAPELDIPNAVRRLPTPENSGSDKEKELPKLPEKERGRSGPALSLKTQDLGKRADQSDDALPLLSASVYNPHEENTPKPNATPQTAVPTTATKMSHSEIHALALNRAKEGSKVRNGSRDRKPSGLQITMPTLDQVSLPQLTATSDHSARKHVHKGSNSSSQQSLHSGSTASGQFPSRDTDGGDLSSAPPTGRSWASSAVKSPSVSGRSMDQYISSLEEANYYAKKKKEALRAARSVERERRSQSRNRSRDHTNDRSDRGRDSTRYIQPAKHSPSSPVPMSPEDLNKYKQPGSASIDSILPSAVESSADDRGNRRDRASSKPRSQSKISHISSRTVREISPDRNRQRKSSRPTQGRSGSRARSPDRLLSPIERGRSSSKGNGSHARSPSSPLPFSPQAALYREDSDNPNPMRLVEANQQRLRSRQRSRARSSSRHQPERGASRSRREGSQDGQARHISHIGEPNVDKFDERTNRNSQSDESSSNSNENAVARNKSFRTLKKEKAAQDLEARRISLINSSQQVIAHPSELVRPSMPERSFSDQVTLNERRPSHSDVSPGTFRDGAPNPFERSASAQPLLGLPSTPRAMKHPKYQQHDVPAMPAIPNQFAATGHPINEPVRSASVPMPETDSNGIHPAYRQSIRPSTTKQRTSFAPLHDIGRARQGSIDAGGRDQLGSIDESSVQVSEEDRDNAIIVVPEYHGPSHSIPTPPSGAVLPQLAHLAPGGDANNLSPPPPPPPPKPHFIMPTNPNIKSSAAGTGTINIAIEGEETHGVSAPSLPSTYLSPPTGAARNSPPSFGSPSKSPPGSGASFDTMEVLRSGTASPPSTGIRHARGRSIENVSSRIMRVAERMRSNSRGRNETMMREREKKTKSPRTLTEGFGEGITTGLKEGQRAPYETATQSYF